MTYNTSIKALQRWKDELDKLLPGEAVMWESREPQKLVYRLREAIEAARHNRIEPYASLDFQFTVSFNTVTATPKHSLAANPKPLETTHPEAKNEFDVISIAGKSKASVFIFPSFNGELESVKNWAAAKGFTMETEPLILRRKP